MATASGHVAADEAERLLEAVERLSGTADN
jgi:hypothetical protein